VTTFVSMPSGLILPERVAEAEVRRMRRPKAMDFFCGAGGFSLGIIQAGFEVVAGVENDAIAAITYMSNLARYGECRIHCITDEDGERLEKALFSEAKRKGGELLAFESFPTAGTGWISHQPRSVPGVSHLFFGDARQLTSQFILDTLGMEKGELDLIVGGPPCQGFSFAGKRQVTDPRSNLVFEYARFIVDLMPKMVCMENVTGIIDFMTPDGVPVLEKFCRILEDGDFGSYDAFRQTFEAQTGRVGLMRGKRVSGSRLRDEQSAEAQQAEMAL
jgi:DNA (cytosine-5)-methyltransferase 1